jgi:CheY-like chemotaxis protein
MNDDLLSFKMLVISEADSDRDLLRRAAAEAAFPIDYAEVADPGDAATACKLVTRDGLDFAFVDSRIPKADRQAVYDAAHSSPGRPLVIFVGPANLKTREVMSDGAAADGVLAKPLDAAEASAVIGVCVRARLLKQVLVVDDSTTVRSVIRKLLQASRFRLEVTEAEDGASAIERASKRRFDVVFLDCNMPGRDGFATLEALKRDHADMQVVMITGTKDFRIEDRARAGGVKEFLFKPFYAKDIDGILYRLFGLAEPKAT